jgi:hypothetical protein
MREITSILPAMNPKLLSGALRVQEGDGVDRPSSALENWKP